MTPTAWTALIIGIIVVASAVLALEAHRKKFKSKFGPEYDRVGQAYGSTLAAEKELVDRAKRVGNFEIHPLAPADTDQLSAEWRKTQELFLDDPRAALAAAGRLVHTAMKARGYPLGEEFEQPAADLSADCPSFVEHYRAGDHIAARDARMPASTEDLRLSMKHYRAILEDLLERRVHEFTGDRRD